MAERKSAIITGASRGIGNAIAAKLASEGYAIVAAGTSDESDISANLDVIRRSGMPLVYVRADVSTGIGRQAIIDRALEMFGRIDVLVNNAGVAPKLRKDILEISEESLDYVLGINLKSTFFLSQAVAKIMLRDISKVPGFMPIIVNISSISAYTSSIQRAEYCISKAAVSMVTLLYADRLAGEGINVYEIRPGLINTEMTAAVKDKYDALIDGGVTPIKRWGQPQDIANAVSALCSGLLRFSTGEVINVDGGFHIRRL
jgi:NAD(P)-dependent dehydrogenase (short-subunit alcohol dehydrogenase family)